MLSTTSYEIFEGCDVSKTTNHPILMLIWITIQIQEFLTEFHHSRIAPILSFAR